MPSPRVAGALATLILCLGACATGEDSARTSTTPPGTATSTTAITAEPATASTTVVDSSTILSEPGVLRGDGLGPVRIGDAEDAAIDALTLTFGQPTSDVVNDGPFSDELRCWAAHGIACYSYLRVVEWEEFGLSVIVSDWVLSSNDEPEIVQAPPNLRGFEYTGGRSPETLQTAHGITIGSTLDDLRAAYGDDLNLSEDPCAFDTEYGFTLRSGPTMLGGLWGQLSREPIPGLVESIGAGTNFSNC